MNTVPMSQGKAMYVASSSDRDWLLNVQRKLYAQSWENSGYVFRKLFGLVTDLRNFRCAFERVSRNKGARSAGVDGITVGRILSYGVEDFIEQLRVEIRSRKYRPNAVRKVLIPKGRKPGEFRPLGIPTVKDRVVQAAMKNIMEPIFEADFYPCSFGFRTGKSVHGALEQIRKLLNSKTLVRSPKEQPRLTYQWAIEGDIKGCFDNISHHGLMNRVRRRIGDGKLNRLIVAFLKAGVLSNGQFQRTEIGTPQGGILSPLLANIALSIIDERYERYVWPRYSPRPYSSRERIGKRAVKNRYNDKCKGKPVYVPVRYADDFIILVYALLDPERMEQGKEVAEQEKAVLSKLLKESLNLELSETKTAITSVMKPIRFLGYHFRVQCHPVYGWVSTIVIPKDRSLFLREQIKAIFKQNTLGDSLECRLKKLNPIIRGWGYFYRHAWGAKEVFSSLDNYVWHTIHRWLKKKHPRTGFKQLSKRYGRYKSGMRSFEWCENSASPFKLTSLRVERFRSSWDRRPTFTLTSMESPVRNERRTPGSEEGAWETAR